MLHRSSFPSTFEFKTWFIRTPSTTTTSSNSSTHSDNSKSDREITKYVSVVERFLSHYYPAMRNAPSPKEVANDVFTHYIGCVMIIMVSQSLIRPAFWT